ncbi:MAG: hypothetical protein H3C33_16990, partial [Rhodocyclaceae bacterium]|nr:hypothetical protein [Rhodocyclaceae bacterium]
LADTAIRARTAQVEGANAAAEANERVSASLTVAARSARAFAEELARADAANLVAQFDEIIKGGGDVESTLKKISEGLEFGSPDKIAAFARGLEELARTGRISAEELSSAWSAALSVLNSAQLDELARNVKAAFEDGKVSAAEFSRVNDEVLIESFRRLGLSAEDALGKVSPAARAALQSLETIRGGLAGLGVDGKTKMDLLGRAITAALSRADTRAALVELRQKIVDMGKGGEIAEAQMVDALKTIEAKFKELSGEATTAGDTIVERMKAAADALAKSREETKRLRDAMRGTASAAAEAGDAAKKAGEETEKAGKKAEEVRASFAEPFLQGAAAASRFAAEAQRIGEEVFS